ncbi:MAG: ZIP family metal transporter [Candidatus Omnitrophica bacterium]|nr:ZIP family metal transporter [Candidatus Omnitrophota bacterium]
MTPHLSGPWLLGLLAGGTIFLGLPIARFSRVSSKTKAFLNAVSTGILIFLLVEITGHLIEEIEELVESAIGSGGNLSAALRYGGLFALGFSAGLLSLVYFEKRFLGSIKDQETAPARKAKQLAMMIAVGLGLHNLSEGLAIGQGYVGGAMQLAWLMAIGFALHNATEGFGIAAPLSGHRASWGFLGTAGLIAGGPTFLGTLIGSGWTNKSVEIFCLALAAGTILYIIGELLHLGRLLKGEAIVEMGLLVGFFVAMASDFTISAAMEMNAPHAPRHGGYFGDANDLYHYELIPGTDNRLLLYVNDQMNRPLEASTLQGRWTLNPDSSAPTMGFFTPSREGNFLVGELPGNFRNDPIHVRVEVLKGTAWAPMEFYVPRKSSKSPEK